MRLAHVEPYARIVACKICNRLGKGVKAECRGAAYPQLRVIAASQIVCQRADAAFGKDNGAGFLEYPLAERCRHDPLPRAHHQLKTQPSLHQLHVAGQGGLRQPERHRRAGEGSGADDFVELQ